MRIPRGVTLIEVLITVVIVGILAAIAYPSYQRHVLRTYRASAQACLQELATHMERHYVKSMSYANISIDRLRSLSTCDDDLSKRYKFALAPTATAFTIQARPIGPQRGDSCGTLEIRSNGTRSPSNPDCWR